MWPTIFLATRMVQMIARVLASTSECRDGNCPTAFLTDRETVLVQGDLTSDAVVGLQVPPGEGAVEVPVAIILEAAAAILAARGVAV